LVDRDDSPVTGMSTVLNIELNFVVHVISNS